MKRKRLHAVIASVLIHIVLAVLVGLFLTEHWAFNEDKIEVELVKRPARDIFRPAPKPVRQRYRTTQTVVNPSQIPATGMTPVTRQQTQVIRQPQLRTFEPDVLNPDDVTVPSVKANSVRPANSMKTDAAIEVSPVLPTPVQVKVQPNVTRSQRTDAPSAGFSTFLESTLPGDALGREAGSTLQNPVMLPKGKLGAILKGTGKTFRGHVRIIRLKHSLSDWWQDPTAIPALMKWLDAHTTIRADMNFAGGALRLTDARILDAPLLVMTGHDKDITVGRGLVKEGPLNAEFSQAERDALRTYIVDKGGMLFFDDCGFNGLFAHVVADELRQIFPEYPLQILPHEHEIYSIYYTLSKPPIGGDVFWGSENNPKATQFRYQKGISIGNRLAVVYNRKDYMCAMETTEVESRTLLRLRRSTDVYRFMTNLLIYTLKYGGNTDRTDWTD